MCVHVRESQNEGDDVVAADAVVSIIVNIVSSLS